MADETDYYAILGVTPDAEDVVIRAAYKALAQRYHPDRYPGSKAEAHARMAKLNEANATLSDPAKRKIYDDRRKSAPRSTDAFTHAENGKATGAARQYKDWQVVVKFHPTLGVLEARLARFSRNLASTFRSSLLETKDFQNAKSFADKLERGFFQSYFGEDPNVVAFAKKLLIAGRRDAARALSRAMSVRGNSLDARKLITEIAHEFSVPIGSARKSAARRKSVEKIERTIIQVSWGLIAVMLCVVLLVIVLR